MNEQRKDRYLYIYICTYTHTVCVCVCVCVYNGMLFILKKKKETLPFATICMDPVGIMLNETRQTEKNKHHMISLIYEI